MYNPFLTGNKVYRGGSNTATYGTVDPTGYIERELRNRRKKMVFGQQRQGFGNSFQSNRPQQRSGLATAALNRQKLNGANNRQRLRQNNGPQHTPGPLRDFGAGRLGSGRQELLPILSKLLKTPQGTFRPGGGSGLPPMFKQPGVVENKPQVIAPNPMPDVKKQPGGIDAPFATQPDNLTTPKELQGNKYTYGGKTFHGSFLDLLNNPAFVSSMYGAAKRRAARGQSLIPDGSSGYSLKKQGYRV